MANILFCHDNIDFAETQVEVLSQLHGQNAKARTTASDSLHEVKTRASHYDAFIVHKDLGLGREKYSAEDVVEAIHEEAPWGILIVVSGEYPEGRQHVVSNLHADIYMSTIDVSTQRPWLLDHITTGPVSPEGQLLRGTSVTMPPASRR